MTENTEAEKDDTFRTPTADFAESLERGDEVEFEYVDGDGDTAVGTGVVCKAPKNKVVVLLMGARRLSALRVFKTDHYGAAGRVHKNNREGNGRKKNVGTEGKLRRTGNRVSVSYKQMSGYRVAGEE